MTVLHADARTAELPTGIDGIVTSPPYPGLIDYHEQHRYAYELLQLDDRRELELGAAAGGTSRRAVAELLRRHRRGAGPRPAPPDARTPGSRSSSTTAATSTETSPAAAASSWCSGQPGT